MGAKTRVLSKERRRAQLEQVTGAGLVKILMGYNPFGGYITPHSEGAKKSMIDTIIRFEYQES